MKIIIDADRFKDYTVIHKADIGIDPVACCSGIVTGLSVFIPAIQDIKDAGRGTASNWILLIVGMAAFGYGVYKMIQFLRSRYTSNNLYCDVTNMDETQHRFSLVAVKDTFNPYPNKFLLRHDDDWDCDLFFSFPTLDDETADIGNIKSRLSHLLKVDRKNISVRYIDETLQTKYSQKDKITKVYAHKLYRADIKDWPMNERAEAFSADGTRYIWETIDEMRNDPEIQKKNLDVVDFVSANIP